MTIRREMEDDVLWTVVGYANADGGTCELPLRDLYDEPIPDDDAVLTEVRAFLNEGICPSPPKIRLKIANARRRADSLLGTFPSSVKVGFPPRPPTFSKR